MAASMEGMVLSMSECEGGRIIRAVQESFVTSLNEYVCDTPRCATTRGVPRAGSASQEALAK